MCSTNKSLNFTDLCDDLLCQIFDRLRVKQVLSIQTVNKDFYRSAQTWLKTVNTLLIDAGAFKLEKTFPDKDCNKKPSKFRCNQTLFPTLDKMLTTCTGIKNVEFGFDPQLNSSQVVHLISRCREISSVELTFSGGETRYTDEDWTRLIQLIVNKQCEVALGLDSPAPTHMVNQLEQLFTAAKQQDVWFFCFNKPLFQLIELLDESVTTVYLFTEHDDGVDNETFDDEVCDLISRYVYRLTIKSMYLQSLAERGYSKLVQLDVTHHREAPSSVITGPFNFPRLRLFQFFDSTDDGRLISSFFLAVNRMDQLKILKLISLDFSDEKLKNILKKTPNIDHLWIYWYCFSGDKIPAFRKMFFSLSCCSSIRFPEDIEVRMKMAKLTAKDAIPMTESLAKLASVKTNTKLTFIFRFKSKERKIFEKKIHPLPQNLDLIY